MRFPMTASFSRSFASSAASREVEYSRQSRLGGGEDDNDDETAADADDEGTPSEADYEDNPEREGSNNTDITTTTTFECHEQVRFMDSGWILCWNCNWSVHYSLEVK
jgi:hypothetical protein